MELMFHPAHAPTKLGYTRVSLSEPRPRFGWFALRPTRCRLDAMQELKPGVEAVADVESKLRQDITPASDAVPLFGPVASEAMRYLASFAMTAAATVVAIGVDTSVTIPNLSLVFVVPVIVAGISLGLGPSLCSAILGALAFNFFLTEH